MTIDLTDAQLASMLDELRERLFDGPDAAVFRLDQLTDDENAFTFGAEADAVLVPLVFREVVVDVDLPDGVLAEFVAGQGQAVAISAGEGDSRRFERGSASELAKMIAAYIAAAEAPGASPGAVPFAEWDSTLGLVLGRPAAEIPPAAALIPLRVSTAAGVSRRAVAYHHGSAFSWLEPSESPRMAWAESLEQLEEVIDGFLERARGGR